MLWVKRPTGNGPLGSIFSRRFQVRQPPGVHLRGSIHKRTVSDITGQEDDDRRMAVLALGGTLAFLVISGWVVFVYLRRALRLLERSVKAPDRLARGDLRDEMFNLLMLRDELVRLHLQQERLIRRRLRRLADTLEEDARTEVQAALEPPQNAELARTDNSLVQIDDILRQVRERALFRRPRRLSACSTSPR